MSALPPADDPQEAEVADLLTDARPEPPADFRHALDERLRSEDPGWGPRPRRLWLPALGLTAAGSVLLLAGALIAVGGH